MKSDCMCIKTILQYKDSHLLEVALLFDAVAQIWAFFYFTIIYEAEHEKDQEFTLLSQK